MGACCRKKLLNVKVALKILPNGKKAPIGHQFVWCHMVFDIKMENLQRKVGLAAGGHTTWASATTTYESVVSIESE